MKRLFAYILAVIMLLGMVTGCASNKTEAKEPAPPEEQTEEQTAEPEEPTLPTREELEEMGFALLADKPLYNSELLQEGLASVQWMDLDEDGLEELLVLSVDTLKAFDNGDIEQASVTFEVYGYLDGELNKYGDIHWISDDFYRFSIKLFEKEGQAYFGTYSHSNSGPLEKYSFLRVENHELTTKEYFMSYLKREYVDQLVTAILVNHYLHSFENIFDYDPFSDADPPNAVATEVEFWETLSSYEEVSTIVSYSESTLSFEEVDDNRLMDRLREVEAERKAREEQERLEQERKNAYKIVVNGKTIESDLYPKEINGELLVPMHSTFEAMGVLVSECTWGEAYLLEDVNNRALFVTTKKDSVPLLILDSDDGTLSVFARCTGEGIYANYAEIDGHSYISLDAISWGFPISVNVNAESRTINITSSISDTDRADTAYVEKMLAFTWQSAEQIIESKGYKIYSQDNVYYEGGKRWVSLLVFDPSATPEEIAAETAEVGIINVAHDGTIGQYEYIGRPSDIFWG